MNDQAKFVWTDEDRAMVHARCKPTCPEEDGLYSLDRWLEAYKMARRTGSTPSDAADIADRRSEVR